MTPPLKKTVFKDDWLLDPQFSAIVRGKYETEAFCSLCKKTVQLSNMGVEALKSHVIGKKHVAQAGNMKRSGDIRMFTTSIGRQSSPSTAPERAAEVDDPSTVKLASVLTPTTPTTTSDAPSQRGEPNSTLAQSRISQYCLKDDVTAAEIVWCLQAVENYSSFNAAARQAALFERMFPDSIIVKQLELGANKIGYSITFGLGPYFFEQVLNDIRKADAFVVGFDESLNKKSQKLQMDLFVCYWSEKTNDAQCRYFFSAFLDHSRAKDLSKALQEHLKELVITKMIQVAMDGPNVNYAAIRDLANDIKDINGNECSLFLNLGSCGLHTVNNSYKQAFKSVKWKLLEFMRGSFNIFKDVPARKGDYTRFSGEKKPVFPQKFCAVRWLENETVALTALKALPNLQKFVEGVHDEKIKIKSKSFEDVKNGLSDKLLPAKLAFFAYIAQQLKPFLTEYQCTTPMIPFLYTDLSSLIKDILAHFVKAKVIDEAVSVAAIDLSKAENLLPVSEVKLGHATKGELRKVVVSKDEMKKFRADCRDILLKMCQILIDKSPVSLKYRVAKYVTFCDPALIFRNLSASKTRLSNALQAFMANNWMSGQVCDKISSEFQTLTSKNQFISDCKSYSRNDQRIDHFWRAHLEGNESYKTLFLFLKKVLILSHGQAFVERGFSVNKNLIVENQLAKSLIAQRHVYDAVKAAGGVKSFQIDKKLMSAFRLSRSNQKDALQRQNEENKEERAKAAQKRSMAQDLADLKAKRAKLASEKTALINALDDEIAAMINKFG